MAKKSSEIKTDLDAEATSENREKLNKLVRPNSKLVQLLIRYIRSGRRFLFSGPPALAKSSLIHVASDAVGNDMLITAAGTRERVDFSGAMFPDLQAGYARELLLETTYRLVHADKPITWFLDDLGNAEIDVQSAIKSLITCGGAVAKNPNVFVCGATNRPGDKTGVRAIHESLKSEFNLAFSMPVPDMADSTAGTTFFGDWRTFVEGWVDWAMDYGAAPEIIAWHRNAAMRTTELGGSSLYDWKPNPDPAFRSADCRTWKTVIDLWNDGLRDTLTIGAAIGKARSTEFLAFAALTKDLPHIDQIRMSPADAPIPEDSAALYLITAILAAGVEPEWLDEMCVYMERLPRVYQALLMRDTYRKHGSVISGTKRFVKAFLDNKQLFNANSD